MDGLARYSGHRADHVGAQDPWSGPVLPVEARHRGAPMPEVLERETAIARDVHWTSPERHHPMPVIVTVPSRDMAFRVHVEAAMFGDSRAAPDALEAVLRRAYPRAVVHAGDSFGTIRSEVRWYVY